MTTQVSGTTGVSKVQDGGTTGVSKAQDGVVVQADLAANVVGNGPAFITSFTGTTVQASTSTEMTTNVVGNDTSGSMNAVNGRFTPQVAGYYQFNADVSFGPSAVGGAMCQLRKNNSAVIGTSATGAGVSEFYSTKSASGLVYLNGSTDFVSVMAYTASGNVTATGHFSGFLARAA